MNNTLDDLIHEYTFDGDLVDFYRANAGRIGALFLDKLAACVDVNEFAIMCTIILDLRINSNIAAEEKDEYERNLNRTGLFEKFSTYLLSDRLCKRSNAITTLGRFSITENARYLEHAFEHAYYLNDPISAARALCELTWLHSDKAQIYLDMLRGTTDPLAMLALGIYYTSAVKAADYVRLKDKYKTLRSIEDPEEYFLTYEIIMQNIHNVNDIAVWSRAEYVASIDFYDRARMRLGKGAINYKTLLGKLV